MYPVDFRYVISSIYSSILKKKANYQEGYLVYLRVFSL
jgi:hypothetical protein